MFRQPPPQPEFFDEDPLPTLILGVVVFGACAVGVAVTGGTLLSVLILAVLSGLYAAAAVTYRPPGLSAHRRTDEPGRGNDGPGYGGEEDDERPSPDSGPSDDSDLFDWESFTEQFWAHVRDRKRAQERLRANHRRRAFSLKARRRI